MRSSLESCYSYRLLDELLDRLGAKRPTERVEKRGLPVWWHIVAVGQVRARVEVPEHPRQHAPRYECEALLDFAARSLAPPYQQREVHLGRRIVLRLWKIAPK